MKVTKHIILPIFLFTIYALTVSAQQIPPSPPTNEDLQKRIAQMEAEMKLLREEMDKLKSALPAVSGSSIQNANYDSTARKSDVKPDAKPDEKPEASKQTASSEKNEAASPQQTKSLGVDVGSARLTPYGTIYFNAFTNSAGTNNADVPAFATPTGVGTTSASVRQTRFGLKLEGGRVGNARLSGVVEVDFYGGFPSVGIGENFGVVRLRLANARFDWEKTSVVVGQDWMVFAPVSPNSLAAAAIPQMAAAGNNWARLPQVKIETKLSKNFTLQGAVLAPQTGDFVTNASFFLQPTSGSSSRVPYFQSRLAFADGNFLGTKKAGSVGLSAHYGRSRVFTGASANIENDIDSLGVALDWNFPLVKRLSLAGEAFFGRNLGGFQGGVFQGYNNDFAYRNGGTLVPGGARAIGTRGGWMQLGFTPDVWQDRLAIYGSIGIDDPREEDLVSRTPRDFRRQNFSYAFDAIYKLTPQFQIGAEFRRMQTLYLLSGGRDANHFNLGAAYSF